MRGLRLAQAYYEEYGEAMLKRFAGYSSRIAAGLVGHGSECYGFDDEISADHDYGPGFCLWLNAEDYQAIGGDLQKAYETLPGSYLGFPPRNMTAGGANRVGVLEAGAFYREFIGRTDVPRKPIEWFRIPEEGLAAVTNGMVFRDPAGEFTSVREGLRAYYPEDVRVKKIAARAAGMARAGQYNYARCMQREELVAARLALDDFVRQTMSICYLLCRAYMPYFKWAHRGLREFSMPRCIREGLIVLSVTGVQSEKWRGFSRWKDRINTSDDNIAVIEDICSTVREELVKQSLTEGEESFLEIHAHRIMGHILDPQIRGLMVMDG